ncbi:matrixin family metalloprotease [Halarcobacter sp.]|uniref:matrixin family metalloprotease n=1 Tax=Halarcobacter sp. TaxID=2321133 RepID=UPI0029F4B3D7|nr:matrixin family metalloprotease [Halarcobacter sp.]
MFFKINILILILFSFVNASFEKVSIGTIDKHYKISKEQIYSILKEIEFTFEKELDKDVFDYADDGKPINFIYLPPSKLENEISRKISRIESKKQKIQELKDYFPNKKNDIENTKEILSKQQDELNNKVRKYNNYIKTINSKKSITKEELNKVKTYSKKEKTVLNDEIKKLKAKRRELRREIIKFNSKVTSFNNLINDLNRLNIQLEAMNRNYSKIRGRTFGLQTIEKKTTFKDGKKKEEQKISISMDKIEIYGFKNLDELKIILAHEIAHLVGLPHVNEKNALMNPIIQKSQLEKGLNLTPADIQLFDKYLD